MLRFSIIYIYNANNNFSYFLFILDTRILVDPVTRFMDILCYIYLFQLKYDYF